MMHTNKIKNSKITNDYKKNNINKNININNFFNSLLILSIIIIGIFILISSIINLQTIKELKSNFIKVNATYSNNTLSYLNKNNEEIYITELYDKSNNKINLSDLKDNTSINIYCNKNNQTSGLYFKYISPITKTIISFIISFLFIIIGFILFIRSLLNKIKNKK